MAPKAGAVEEIKGTQAASAPTPANHLELRKTGGEGMCPFKNGMAKENPAVLRDTAARIVREHTFGDDTLKKAQYTLECALGFGDPDGKTSAQLGLVFVHMQQWGDAVKHLQVAVQRDPNNKNAAELLRKAKDAVQTRADLAMGSIDATTTAQLKASPMQLREPEDIRPFDEPPAKGLKDKIVDGAKNQAQGAKDWALGGVLSLGEWVAPKLPSKDDRPWFYDQWQNRGLIGSLVLANTRSKTLNGPALNTTYEDGIVAGIAPGSVQRPKHSDRFRTANGTWNTDMPMEGAAGTQFARTGASAVDQSRQNRMNDPSLPSAREVSRLLLATEPGAERKEAPFLNAITASWIQFMTHDWMNHTPAKPGDGTYRIKLAKDDPFRQKYGVEFMEVPKTSADPMRNSKKNTSSNEVTHWWDGSQIYGSDQATADRLRQGPNGKRLADGKMRIDGELLPVNAETGVEDTGFARNMWVGLSLLHSTFVKHHNYICDELKKANPTWSTDQLFETARMVNAAIMAKIHTIEWTPAVLPGINDPMNINWFGYEEVGILGDKKPHDARRVLRPGKSSDKVLGGLVGNPRDNKGQPFAFSEEFVTDYLLGHPLMPDHIKLKRADGKDGGELQVENTRGVAARKLIEKHGITTLLNSMGNQNMPQIINNNYPAFMSDMTAYGPSVMDLGTTDIVRGRERGIPPYNEFRRQVGLKPITKFEDLVDDKKYKNPADKATDPLVVKLKALYGADRAAVEKLDFHVGVLCEGNRPEYFGFGETQFHIFIQMASRRLESDPFYTDKFNAKYYSKRGIELVEGASLKKILLQHYPELKKSGLIGVNNPFEPWSSQAIDKNAPNYKPEAHPLTSAGLETYK